jgi:Leucine-rich repeat (LRR) protein
LTFLTSLDLSHNALLSLPANLFALPSLTFLNVSHNALSSLPFHSPFASDSNCRSKSSYSSGDNFFAPIIARATSPLPCLLTLDASYNKISASAIDHGSGSLPTNLSKIDLSANPLAVGSSKCSSLIQALGGLERLKELHMQKADIGDNEFPPNLFSLSSTAPFPALTLFDLGETGVTGDAARTAFRGMKQALSFTVTAEAPPEGVLRVIIGKKVAQEVWELGTERKARTRTAKVEDVGTKTPVAVDPNHRQQDAHAVKEPWEIEAEQGLLTEGGRRRARAVAAASMPSTQVPEKEAPRKVPAVVKEAWEIEAEQGLLTEGGRRRARIAAAAANIQPTSPSGDGSPSQASVKASPSPSSLTLSNPQYYSATTRTLKLPPSAPPSKAHGHSRAFSLATSSSSSWSSSRTTDIAVPTPTLPLAAITSQTFAQTLSTLILANRRMDRTFSLPFASAGVDGPWLPNLEELSLEGCGFGDIVNVSRQQAPDSGSTSPPRSSEMLLPLLMKLFPSLRTLDLSYNLLTSAALRTEVLTALILSSSGDANQPPRRGLRHLRLRGNKITDLDEFRGIAQLFRGNRDVPAWKLEELDLRDNEINKLPPELGLMPLDVFLVDGNM